MKNKSPNRTRIMGKIIWLAIGLGAFYWILESILHAFLLRTSSFTQALFPLTTNEIWMRFSVVSIILLSGVYARFIINKHKRMEEALRASEEWFSTTLSSIGDAVISTDTKGYVTFINPVAQTLTGWNQKDAIGKSLKDVFNIINEKTGKPVDNPVSRIIQEGVVVGLANHTVLIAKDGTKRPIDDSGAPIRGDRENITGIVLVFRDITERKQAEEALQESEEKYRSLFENMLDGFAYCKILIDENNKPVDFVYLEVNDAFERLTGLKKEDVVGKKVTEAIPGIKESHPELFNIYGKVALTGEPTKFDICFEPLAIWLTISVYSPQKGYFVAVFENIIERKQAEELFKTLANSSPVGVYIVQDGKFQYVNPAFQTYQGRSKDELIGTDPLSLVHPRDRKMVRENAIERLKGASATPYEYRTIAKAGETRWVVETVTSIQYQGRRATLGNYIDITERKQAEEKLRENAEFTSSLLNNSPYPILVINPDTSIRYVNPALENLTGFTSTELIGQKAPYPWWMEEELKRDEEQLEETMRRGAKRLEKLFQKKNGERFWVEITSASTRRNRELMYHLVSWVDITQRKQAEREKEEVEQKTRVNNRLATVGQLASGIAHEINNPLTGVIGFTQLLQQKDIPENIRKDIKIIHEGAQRVASIVKRLLIFARAQKPGRKEISVNETITATVALRAYEMETSDIKLTMQLAPDLPGTVVDGGQLQQVFLNLILNAETEMKLAHGKGNLLITTEAINNTIRISFKDDGPGIPKENLERIFDPFFTTREVGQGTGLGLSICHGIVTEHGGRIYAKSKPGKGATFIVELPIVTEAKEQETAEPAAVETESEVKPKTLVVDDEPIIQQFLSETLTEKGHEVECVGSTSDALEKIKTTRYSLILLDIKMPGMSGIQLYEHLQRTAQSLAKKVVFITGDVMGEDTWRFFRKTKAPYLMKPFSEEQLLEGINHILPQ